MSAHTGEIFSLSLDHSCLHIETDGPADTKPRRITVEHQPDCGCDVVMAGTEFGPGDKGGTYVITGDPL